MVRLSNKRVRLVAKISVALNLVFVGAVILRLVIRVPRYKYDNESLLHALRPERRTSSGRESVALGCAVTSRVKFSSGQTDPCSHDHGPRCRLNNLPVFSELLPSFCKTCSLDYDYHLYLAYDYDDPVLQTESSRVVLQEKFQDTVDKLCAKNTVPPRLHLVRSPTSHQPASAQNDAMMAAYTDNITYLFRINDDTIFYTPGWTESFIDTLKALDPPLVGIVGPHTQGESVNKRILTYEFVHRTHVDIFGYYYPPFVKTWYADDWITHVYLPGRAVRLEDVFLMHSQAFGRRYKITTKPTSIDCHIQLGKEKVSHWITDKLRLNQPDKLDYTDTSSVNGENTVT